MNNSEPFCGPIWNTFQYILTNNLYGYVSLIFVTIGILLSSLTLITFAKKSLHSPSNILFLSLAISDWIVLTLSIPQLWMRISNYNIHYALDQGSYTRLQRIIDHYSNTLEKIFYNVSLYQTMMLAVWRYIAITYPLKERILCNVKMTLASVITVYLLCILCFVPDLVHIPCSASSCDNVTFAYDENASSTRNMSYDHFSTLFYHLTDIILLKVIPCTVVAICTLRFVRVLRESKKRRTEMIPYFKKRSIEKRKRMNRTTKMVLGITIFFLVNNILLAIAKSLILIYGHKFETDCSPGITCVNNLFALIYTTIPFIVYYITCQQFRHDFKSVFCNSKY